jgi:hypothetical protein
MKNSTAKSRRQKPANMTPQTEHLKRCYKRYDCTDRNDFVYAIESCKSVARRHGWTPALIRRAASLSNGLRKLEQKDTRSTRHTGAAI